MTIASEITKLQTNLSDSYTACSNKGATLPANQNFDNLSTTIDSIPSGGGDDKMYGITIKDLWYSQPNPYIETSDPNAPHMDMSSWTLSASQFHGLFYYGLRAARIKSFNGPVITSTGDYMYHSAFLNNKCIKYVKISYANYPSSYNLYNTCYSSSVSVFIFNYTGTATTFSSTTPLYGMLYSTSNLNHACFFGFKALSANTSASMICRESNIKTLWFQDLEGLNKNLDGGAMATNQGLYRCCYGCPQLIGLFFPKLKEIGTNSSTNSYAQLKECVTNTSSNLPYLYFPALTAIYNVHSTATNGTFAASTGIKKIYLPALTTIDGSGNKNIFNGCSNLTEIHFGKANQSTIEANSGYSTLWGRGAGAATVYFDLINTITVDGKTYKRTQYNDYMTSITYDNKTYYRDDNSRTQHNIGWRFWVWKAQDDSIVYTQYPLTLVGEPAWSYVKSGSDWDYNVLGNITANDWRYAWTNTSDTDDIIYTTNQWTPAVNDPTYTVASDGKSFVEGSTITAVA